MTNVIASDGLFHGGNILAASKASGIPLEAWLDLSTGISPYAYPSQALPPEVFSRLPYIDEAFNASVEQYYGRQHFVALSGTQVAIQLIPSLLETLPVLLPSVGYQEHRQAWEVAGNSLYYYNALDEDKACEAIELKLKAQPKQHVVIINPNNPSALLFTPQQLLAWAEKLSKGAYLIVDEAFIDVHPSESLVPLLTKTSTKNIIVLRSFGKFFGLAGLRLGFVFADEQWLRQFEALIPLWSINGPALYLATKALVDKPWQRAHQRKLAQSEHETRLMFAPFERSLSRHHRLFSSYYFQSTLAAKVFEVFHQNGILLRHIAAQHDESILRVGRIVTEDEQAKERIRQVLAELRLTVLNQ